MNVVIDTNILVSALWKPSGNASLILSRVIGGMITPCYDSRILSEYHDVLMRPKFRFSRSQVSAILDVFICDGISVVPDYLPDADIKDEDDRAFYEVAKFCSASLVTGNLKHFPVDSLVMSPADFCALYFPEQL